MKKPSLKDRLSASKIEEANRMLLENNRVEEAAPEAPAAVVVAETKPVVKKTQKVAAEKPKIEAPKRSNSRRQSLTAKAAEAAGTRLVRLTIDIPEDLHEELKIKMIRSRTTIKDYLLSFIERDVQKS